MVVTRCQEVCPTETPAMASPSSGLCSTKGPTCRSLELTTRSCSCNAPTWWPPTTGSDAEGLNRPAATACVPDALSVHVLECTLRLVEMIEIGRLLCDEDEFSEQAEAPMTKRNKPAPIAARNFPVTRRRRTSRLNGQALRGMQTVCTPRLIHRYVPHWLDLNVSYRCPQRRMGRRRTLWGLVDGGSGTGREDCLNHDVLAE